MAKKMVVFLILSSVAFGQSYWPSGYHPRYYNNNPIRHHRYTNYGYYNRYQGVSGGTATAIGIGAGLAGYIIGSKTSSRREKDRIVCEDFPVKVTVEGKDTIGTVKKCRVGDGDWQIP